jgi:S-DNA-T family DNA segregation ATPase FtsK/SpoIIIE
MHLFTARATSPVAKLGIWSSVSVGPAQAIEQARVLAEDIRGQGSEGDAAVVVVFERLDDVVADGGEFDFEALVKACLDHDHFVIAEADAQFFSSNDGLNSRLKTSRTGVILHPEGTEGYHVFRVDVPTLDRADLPPGRGFYVSRGAVELVQVAIP